MAIAVTDLINTVDTASLHLNGELTKEYLGMLSLYAIRRARAMFEDEERFKDYVKLSYECFEPDNMSDNLIRCLTDIVNEAVQHP